MSAPLVIEKGVPIPKRRQNGFAATLRAMEVGDSVLVSLAGRASAASVFGRFRPKEFTTRKEGDGGLRIWRTA